MTRPQKEFFKTTMVPGKAGGGKLFERKLVVADDVSADSAKLGSIRCLGMTFESEDARRAYFLERLKAKLPELRKRPDFPIAEDEDILRLSDPPYYTACPNPFLGEFVALHGQALRSKGTVPPGAFRRGRERGQDRWALPGPRLPHQGAAPGHRAVHPSLHQAGRLGPGWILWLRHDRRGCAVVRRCAEGIPSEPGRTMEKGRSTGGVGSAPGHSGDLSPAATFIAANYNIPFDVDAFAKAARRLLDEVEEEIGWMYETLHTDGKTKGRINYTVWRGLSCPECAACSQGSSRPSQQSQKQFQHARLNRLYVSEYDVDAFAKAARRLLDEVEEEIGWMYETLHTDGKTKGRINYTVWSEVFSCPECGCGCPEIVSSSSRKLSTQ